MLRIPLPCVQPALVQSRNQAGNRDRGDPCTLASRLRRVPVERGTQLTPQQRTRDNLTTRGYLVGTVEGKKRFPDKKKSQCRACGHIPMIEISVDLFNIFDIVALHPLEKKQDSPVFYSQFANPIVFVQTTTRANHATRRNKILGSMEAKLVLLSGARILIQSWNQVGGQGSKWQFFDEWITLDQFKDAHFYPNTVAELVELRRKEKKPALPKGSTLPLETIEDFDNLPF